MNEHNKPYLKQWAGLAAVSFALLFLSPQQPATAALLDGFSAPETGLYWQQASAWGGGSSPLPSSYTFFAVHNPNPGHVDVTCRWAIGSPLGEGWYKYPGTTQPWNITPGGPSTFTDDGNGVEILGTSSLIGAIVHPNPNYPDRGYKITGHDTLTNKITVDEEVTDMPTWTSGDGPTKHPYRIRQASLTETKTISPGGLETFLSFMDANSNPLGFAATGFAQITGVFTDSVNAPTPASVRILSGAVILAGGGWLDVAPLDQQKTFGSQAPDRMLKPGNLHTTYWKDDTNLYTFLSLSNFSSTVLSVEANGYEDLDEPGKKIESTVTLLAARGASVVEVDDADKFLIGERIYLESSNGSDHELQVITAIDTGTDELTVGAKLQHSFPANSMVHANPVVHDLLWKTKGGVVLAEQREVVVLPGESVNIFSSEDALPGPLPAGAIVPQPEIPNGNDGILEITTYSSPVGQSTDRRPVGLVMSYLVQPVGNLGSRTFTRRDRLFFAAAGSATGGGVGGNKARPPSISKYIVVNPAEAHYGFTTRLLGPKTDDDTPVQVEHVFLNEEKEEILTSKWFLTATRREDSHKNLTRNFETPKHYIVDFDTTSESHTDVGDFDGAAYLQISYGEQRTVKILTRFSPGPPDDPRPHPTTKPRKEEDPLDPGGGVGGSVDVKHPAEGADPILFETGAYLETLTDLFIPGRTSLDFRLTRTYDSSVLSLGPFGRSWEMGYSIRVLPIGTGNDLAVSDGFGRRDIYVHYLSGGDDKYTTPQAKNTLLFKDPDDTFRLLYPDGAQYHFSTQGRLDKIEDRNNNEILFTYDSDGRLEFVTDSMGRQIDFFYNDENLVEKVRDFTGREILYSYYDGVDGPSLSLRSVQTPATDRYPAGKTSTYTYTWGFADPHLNYNLLTITDSKGQTYLTNVYGTDDTDEELYDRVLQQTHGNGDYNITYTITLSGNKVEVDDREGYDYEYEYDTRGRKTLEKVQDAVTPATWYEKTYEYDADSNLISTTLPLGNTLEAVYSHSAGDPRLRGLLLQSDRNDSSAERLRTTYKYDPIYSMQIEMVEARGNKTGATPSAYKTEYILDYQEVSVATAKVALAAKLGVSETDVESALNASGILMNLGDLNGDSTTQYNGNIIKIKYPKVVSGPSGTEAPGGEQVIEERFRYNDKGQITWMEDAEGIITEVAYYTEGDPNGEGTDWLSSSTTKIGYIKSVTRDPAGLNVSIERKYDRRGNVVQETDPRGNVTDYEVNELNQKTRIQHRQITGQTERYETLLFYDANDNLEERRIKNVKDDGTLASGDAAWLSTLFEYDILEHVTKVTQEVGPDDTDTIVSTFEYNNNEKLISITKPTGNKIAGAYNERNLLTSQTRDPSEGAYTGVNATTTYEYDANGNLEHIIDAERTNSGGDPTDRFTAEYDVFDRIVKVTDPLGHWTEVTYDAIDLTKTIIQYASGAGATNYLSHTSYLYDEVGRAYQRDRKHFGAGAYTGSNGLNGSPGSPGISTDTWKYDADNRLVRARDGKSHDVTYAYDNLNRVTSQTDHSTNRVDFTYDKNDNIKTRKVVDNSGGSSDTFTSTYTYDKQDRQKTAIHESDVTGSQWEFSYDSRNNLTKQIDQEDNLILNEYDGLSRLLKEKKLLDDVPDPDHYLVTTYEYDGNSNLTKMIDALNQSTSYQYDKLDRPDQTTHSDGKTVGSVYDQDGLVTRTTDQNLTDVNFIYDKNHRLESRSVDTTNTVLTVTVLGNMFEEYEYDGLNRMILGRVRALSGGTILSAVDVEYDSFSNVMAEKQKHTATGTLRTISSQHDLVSNRTGCTYPGLKALTIGYDALDRVSSITQNTTNQVAGHPGKNAITSIADYTYLGAARRNTRVYGNGTELKVEYDAHPRVTKYRSKYTGGANIVEFDYTNVSGSAYDKMDNITAEKEIRQGITYRDRSSFTYDKVYRMLTETDNTNTITTTYTFDDVGSRLTRVVNNGTPPNTTTTYAVTADTVNQYATINTVTQGHDNNGNFNDDNVTPTTAGRKYIYDYADRVVKVTDRQGTPATIVEYEFDALGRRIKKDVTATPSNIITHYYYDGQEVIEEYDGPGSGATLEAVYVYGPGLDEILMMDRADDSYFYHCNVTGNVAAITDYVSGSPANIVEWYAYDAYGKLYQAKDSLGVDITATVNATGSPVGNPYLYASRRFDPETGFYHYRARTYNPDTGRFLSRDPIGYADGPNLYTYVNNNPINYTDPLGLFSLSENSQWMRSNPVGSGRSGSTRFKEDLRPQRQQRAFLAHSDTYGFAFAHVQTEVDPNSGKARIFIYNIALPRVEGGRYTINGSALRESGGSSGHVGSSQRQAFRFDSIEGAEAALAALEASIEWVPDPPRKKREEEVSGGSGFLLGALDLLSYIPGPIGSLANLGAAAVHIANNNYTDAAVRVAGAATAWVGGKAVLKGLQFLRKSRKATQALTAQVDDVARIKGACFVAGTLVLTLMGAVPIEEVQAGDLVWSQDVQTGQWTPQEVLRTFQRDYTGELVTVGTAGDAIEATGNHPFWVVSGEFLESRPVAAHAGPDAAISGPETGRWVQARDLQAGDRLLLFSGEVVPVESVSTRRVHLRVYNLEVAENHTYTVGTRGVLVHNNCGASGAGRAKNKLKPDPSAQGPHSTFKTDGKGQVTSHAEWAPNSKNPSGFDLRRRVDTQYANPHTHFNKATKQQVPTPHVHDKNIPGGVDSAPLSDLPR